MKGFFAQFATKTVLTAIIAAADYVVKNDPTNYQTWVNAVIGVVMAASVRQAIAKSGSTVPPTP